MADTIITSSINQNGYTLTHILADYYGLKESDIVDKDSFKVDDILNYSKSGVFINKLAISNTNANGARFENIGNEYTSNALK